MAPQFSMSGTLGEKEVLGGKAGQQIKDMVMIPESR